MGFEFMMEVFGVVEISFGENMMDEDELKVLIVRMMSFSMVYFIGIVVMVLCELGGVVGLELIVYGMSKFSIVDNFIIFLILSIYMSLMVYVIGEKVSNLDFNLVLILQQLIWYYDRLLIWYFVEFDVFEL